MGQGYRWFRNAAGKGKQTAQIFIYEDVGEGWMGGVSAAQFKDDLAKIGVVDQLDVHINSFGGDVFDGLAMYRLLVDNKARVVSFIDGFAASIASIIAMAGNEIRMAESGFIMIHDASGLAMGNAADLRAFADTLDTITGALADVYVKRTSNDAATVRDWMGAETWFGVVDAIEHGFADEMMPNLEAAARFDPRLHRFKAAPESVKAIMAPKTPLPVLPQLARPNWHEHQKALRQRAAAMAQHRIANRLRLVK
jgi:ATP-dependent Clp protease protease subunit